MFAALEHLEGAKGRLELVGERNGAPIFVDYAHKPDALAKALQALRPYAKRKLVVVFGAGGDRDAGKRPLMGAIAAEQADRVIVTDDNPRSEESRRHSRRDPRRGARRRARSATAPRRSARAIAALQPGDALLIAGKGHETGQIVGDQVLPFSDHEAVAAALIIERRMTTPCLWTSDAMAAAMRAERNGALPRRRVRASRSTAARCRRAMPISPSRATCMTATISSAPRCKPAPRWRWWRAAQRDKFAADAPLLVVDDVLDGAARSRPRGAGAARRRR